MNNIEPKFSSNPPEIWPMLEKRYRIPWGPGFAVTWNGTIHSHNIKDIQPDVIEHEKVHIKQQAEYPEGPMVYLDRYMTDEKFQYAMELEAFRVQYRFLLKTETIEGPEFHLDRIVDQLTSPLYKWPSDLSRDKVKADILKK